MISLSMPRCVPTTHLFVIRLFANPQLCDGHDATWRCAVSVFLDHQRAADDLPLLPLIVYHAPAHLCGASACWRRHGI